MVENITKVLKLRSTRKSAARRRAHDTLSASNGAAIPIWQADATDPVAHMAMVFDELPGRRHARSGRHRSN